ncbi:MAG: hypothetical protein U9R24_08545 [Thermodesulfobacteriota bacterium]|nr:hypothetical protein [Thermodesulfobacteriota bacterium]
MEKSAQNDPSCLATVRLRDEEKVREKIDERGNRWFKIYFGSGSHFRNWLNQCREIFGEENIEVEEADSTGLICFGESGEKAYRIWILERQV